MAHGKYSQKVVEEFCRERGILWLDEYIRSDIHGRCKCLVCEHEWRVKFYRIKLDGSGCPKCAAKKRGNGISKYTEEMCRQMAEEKSGKFLGFKTIINTVHGKNRNIKMAQWECGVCGNIFEQRASHVFLRNCWCPKCRNMSRGQQATKYIFETLLGCAFKDNYQGYGVELDGYNRDLKIAYEYNGIQHYTSEFLNFNDDFAERCKRDVLKKEICKSEGVELFVITEERKASKRVALERGDIYVKNIMKDGFTTARDWLIEKGFSSLIKDSETKNVPQDVIFGSSIWNKRIDKICKEKGGKRLNSVTACSDKVQIKCPIHGVWETETASIYYVGCWCPKCANYMHLPEEQKISLVNQWLDFRKEGYSVNASAKKIGLCSAVLYKFYRALRKEGKIYNRIPYELISDEEKAVRLREFLDHKKRGRTNVEAASLLGYSSYRIFYAWYKELDPEEKIFAFPRRSPRDEEKKEIIKEFEALHAAGLSKTESAQKMGWIWPTIRTWKEALASA